MNAQIEILQQRKFEPLFGTYVHEFGHGVVFLANGHSILNLFVRGANAGGGRGGHVRLSALDYTGRPRVPDFPKYMAACAIAGAVSEHLILGVRPSPYLMDGWIDDRHIWLNTLLSYEVK